MSSSLEYHILVRHSIPASVALFSVVLFSVFLLSVCFVSIADAQVSGPPTSTIIPPLVGRSVNPPTGAATLVPRNFVPGSRGFVPVFRAPFSESNGSRFGDRHPHRHHHDGELGIPLVYAVPVPYAVEPGAADDNADSSADEEYQGGPTIFDRRGSGEASYIPPVRDVPTPHSTANVDASVATPDPDPAQEPTLLVFKSGRKLEVGNYAIVGATLFDLTPGHTRKIALAELDLEATRQQNDDRGVAFQLPPPAQAN